MARSPRSSVSGGLSDVSGSPPRLDPNTLALLDTYFSEKAEEERLFQEISAERAAAQIAGLALEDETDQPETEKPMVSVSDFKLAFGEDWQLSQFWENRKKVKVILYLVNICVEGPESYVAVDMSRCPQGQPSSNSYPRFDLCLNSNGYEETFANKLASQLHSMCSPTTTIAFLCCPTAFVAFQHMKRLDGARLFEYDQRFAVLSPKQFIPYDIDDPDVFPSSLKGKVDIAVVDPPFLNEVTNAKVVQTLRQLLHPTSKLIMLTSTSVQDVLDKLYDAPPLGPLRRTSITVEHGRLANDFACWGSWDGAEDLGKDSV